MKKFWIMFFISAIVVAGIFLGIELFKKNNVSNENSINNLNSTNSINNDDIINNTDDISEQILDECTDEYNEIQAKSDIMANSSDEKISPNCKITLKKYYTKCEHTINEYIDIPQELINKTEKELIEKYPYFDVEKYSSTDIVLYKKVEGTCGEHFVLRDDNGKITVYSINDNDEESVFMKTEISTEYLPDVDKKQIQNGIKVYGKEKLNELLENYE